MKISDHASFEAQWNNLSYIIQRVLEKANGDDVAAYIAACRDAARAFKSMEDIQPLDGYSAKPKERGET